MPGAHQTLKKIRVELARALKHGLRAEHLVEHTPELVELMYPAVQHPEWDLEDRAFFLHDETTNTCRNDIGGDLGHAALILFGLAAGMDTLLETRQAHAAQLLGVQPATFRRYHQHHIINDTAYHLYQHHAPQEATHWQGHPLAI
jgi:hypothetical protein